MDVPLKDCLTIQVSEENANSPDFDMANYMNKKIKETLFKKALGGTAAKAAVKTDDPSAKQATSSLDEFIDGITGK